MIVDGNRNLIQGIAGENITVGDLLYISDSTGANPTFKKITPTVQGTNYTTSITGFDSNIYTKILIPTSTGNYILIQPTTNSTTLDLFWIATSGTSVSSITRTTITTGKTIANTNYPMSAYWDDANSRLIVSYASISGGTNLYIQAMAFSFSSGTATKVNEITLRDNGVTGTAGTYAANRILVANGNIYCVFSGGSSLTTCYCVYLSISAGSVTAGTVKQMSNVMTASNNNLNTFMGLFYDTNKYILMVSSNNNRIMYDVFTGTSTITLDSILQAVYSLYFASVPVGVYFYTIANNNYIWVQYVSGTQYDTTVYKVWYNGYGVEYSATPSKRNGTSINQYLPDGIFTVDSSRGLIMENMANITIMYQTVLDLAGNMLYAITTASVSTSYSMCLTAYNSLSDYCLVFYFSNSSTLRIIVTRLCDINRVVGIATQTVTSSNVITVESFGVVTSATGITSTTATDNVFYNDNTGAYGSVESGIVIGKRLSTNRMLLLPPSNKLNI